MRKFYRASIAGVGDPETESGSPKGSWNALQKKHNLDRASLKKLGWRVKLNIDLEESDALVAADVIEAVAPKPVGKVIGFLKGLFGK